MTKTKIAAREAALGPCLHGCGCKSFHASRAKRQGQRICGCGHEEQRHLSAPVDAGVGAAGPDVKVPPTLLRVARAFDELRDALLSALSGRQVAKGVMRWVEESVAVEGARARYATAPAPTSPPALAPRTRTGTGSRPAPVEGLARGPQAVLTVVAQAGARGATRQEIAVLTGYKTRSITTYVSELRQAGYIDGTVATAAGIAALGSNYKPLPAGDALREHWLGRLPQGELRLFEVVLSCYPGGADRAKLREMTGYAERSITTYVSKLTSRQIVYKSGREWRARDALFTRGPA